MLRWTRSIEESATVHNKEDIEQMWKITDDGRTVFGCDDVADARKWCILTLKPIDIFQLQVLNKWLVKYHTTLDYFSPYAYNFRWSVAPLRLLEADFYTSKDHKYEYYWNAELEISWQSIRYSIKTPWNAGTESLLMGKFLGDWHDGTYDTADTDYEDCLTANFWNNK